MCEELPLERLVRHRAEPFQLRFGQRACEALPAADDYFLEPSGGGLRLHGACETALEGPLARLHELYPGVLDVAPLRVKYRTEGEVTLEPVMCVRTLVPPAQQARLRVELGARDAEIIEEDATVRGTVTRGLARLEALLGLPAVIRELGGAGARIWMWLDHYAPVPPDGGGPRAA